MQTSVVAALWFLPFVTPLALWVMISDMKSMRIPNLAVLATFGVFAVIGLIALPFSEYLWRYAHFAVVLLAGFLLSTGRIIGAGDAKYAAVMAPFFALGDLRDVLLLMAVCIIVAFVTHRTARRIPFVRKTLPNWQSWDHKDFPMGLALGATLIFYLLLAVIRGH